MAVPLNCIQDSPNHQKALLSVIFGDMYVDVLEQMKSDYVKRIFCNIHKIDLVKECYTDAQWNFKSPALRRIQRSRYLLLTF